MIKALLRRLPYLSPVRLARVWLKPAIDVTEAEAEDMKHIYLDLAPHIPGVYFDDQPFATNYIAVRKRKILGVVQLVRYPQGEGPFAGYWLMGLYVWPRYRGLGVGNLLSRRVIQQCRDEAAHELHLLVWEENRPAIALYRNLQFHQTALPALEDELRQERQRFGRRRIAMKLEF